MWYTRRWAQNCKMNGEWGLGVVRQDRKKQKEKQKKENEKRGKGKNVEKVENKVVYCERIMH